MQALRSIRSCRSLANIALKSAFLAHCPLNGVNSTSCSLLSHQPFRRALSTSNGTLGVPANDVPAEDNLSDPPQGDGAYVMGLRYTTFTNECKITDESPKIPIFRVVDYNGQLEGGWKMPLSNEEVLDAYKFMVKLSVFDEMLYNVQRQGRISFYVTNSGEEAVQTGVATGIEDGDILWCQYRELGVLMRRGFSLTNVLDQLFSNKGDPSHGRQMPISYVKREIGLQAICTPLTTQLPQAAGCGYALKLSETPHIAVAFFGEGAASEGDFHAAMNFASVKKCQTVFVCRNNAYAISTPAKDQYAGDGIAVRGLAYGMQTMRVDGNDLLACSIAMKHARHHCVTHSEPVCLEFMTYRLGHHSTSDDSSQYRSASEIEAWTQPGVNAIPRTRKLLTRLGLYTSSLDEEVRREAKTELLTAVKAAEKRLKYPIIPGLFDDVYKDMPWNLKEQAEQLRQHLAVRGHHYDMSKFEPESASRAGISSASPGSNSEAKPHGDDSSK